MTEQKDDLEVLYPQPECVEADGQIIEVTPLTVGQIARLMRVVGPIIKSGEVDLYELLGEHPDVVIRVIAISIEREEDWLESLLPDEFLALCEKVFEVNRDFFDRRVMPAVNQLMDRAMPTPLTAAGQSAYRDFIKDNIHLTALKNTH